MRVLVGIKRPERTWRTFARAKFRAGVPDKRIVEVSPYARPASNQYQKTSANAPFQERARALLTLVNHTGSEQPLFFVARFCSWSRRALDA